MKNQRSGTRVALLVLVACGATAGLLAAPPEAVLTPGSRQILRVEEVRSNPRTAATALSWTLVGPEGRRSGGTVPSTEGPEFDAYPSLFNDRETGTPVLVWSRHNGVDYDLALSRFEGGRWTEPVTLVSTEMDEIQPRAHGAPDGAFHLVWNRPGESNGFFYGLFSVDTGVPRIATERVRTGDDGSVTWAPEGGTEDPGTGLFDECDVDPKKCRCRSGGICVTGPPYEGAGVCDSFSVVVGSGAKACLLDRGPDGWSVSTCQPFRGGAGAEEILRSLGRLETIDCQN